MSEIERENQDGGASLAPERAKVKPPRQYSVLLINDDFTPMDFVVGVLSHIFRLSNEDAMRVMLEVHIRGEGVAGTYSREVAETKLEMTHAFAQQSGHPLRCKMVPV